MSEAPADFFGDYSVVSDVRDPYPLFAGMRRDTPVLRMELPVRTLYLVLRYDDVCTVLRDSETYSSEIMREVMGPVMGRTILEMGGQEHTTHRGLISHAFRPKAVERYANTLLHDAIDDLIGRIRAGGQRAELVSQFTTTYPLRVITGMLGIPIRDTAQFQKWSLDIIDYKPQRPGPGLAASRALRDYIRPFLEARKVDPQEDLISELLAAELDGHKLSDDDIFGFILLLLPAGAETTFRLLGNVLFALLAHCEDPKGVSSDPEELRWALEETLRWEPPLLGTARVTTRDVVLRGVSIPAGTMVSAMIGAANRDPEKYEDPDRFDIRRRRDDHLSFGFGRHFCLGYHLARLEVLTAVRSIFEQLPNLRLDPREDTYIKGMSFRSPNHLPVVFG